MRFRNLCLSLLFACSAACSAQDVLNNDTIKQMHAAGLGDDLIISMVSSHVGTYSTSVSDMIALKSTGLSDQVIAAMSAKNSGTTVATVIAPLAPVSSDASVLSASVNASAVLTVKPRVFLVSASHGSNQNASRDQSMEMSKDFERDCTGVRITLNQSMADYTVNLNHIEVGLFIRDNQFQIADKNGDLISRTKEGGSIAGGVKKTCQLLLAEWSSKQH